VLAILADVQFLSALAGLVGPLAVFAAPTEEIEHLLLADETRASVEPAFVETAAPQGHSLPKAA
jgi:hypothetical protein